MNPYVDIHFECLPLRSIGRLDIPLDASPGFRKKCEKIKEAMAKHGSFNAYFLHNASAVFHLTNNPEIGMLEFKLQGTLLTDPTDQRAESCDFEIELVRETCDWITTPIMTWFHETVERAVLVEFDRYIAAGDREKAIERLRAMQAQSDDLGGYLGMGL